MTRRGLTLLEVVLATALLALTAGGAASAVSAILQPIDRVQTDPITLVAAVDEILRNPARHEFDPGAVAASGRGALRVDEMHIDMALDARSGRGAWIVFTLEGQHIARWVRVPEAQP